jgi:multidrug efflux pump subunit AcrA (membrane-fusion protein)
LTGAGEQAPLGATVTVRLTGGKPATSAMIAAPVGALIDKGQGPSVWVIDSKTSTVSLRPVKIGRLGEETVGLASGVNVGERIVAFGAHLLKAGQKVALLTSVKTGNGL